jgi:hypothetical protein
MQLTKEEYNVVMQAINNAKAAIADNEFIDYYAENPDGYTNESLAHALDTIETKLMAFNPY